ncbi:MAG: alpha/beta fold hydrolase [Chloroflexi bacterium]|nr:alpha/beta fold hydrolase [Chloroflexota bacterium]
MPFIPDYPVPEKRQPYTEVASTTNKKKNGRVGILMLHGYMGSPLSSHPMAKYLAEHGVTVHCPLLPGHGHHPDKLQGYGRQDWIAASEEGLAKIRELADEIFLMGHSMGCVLGARLAQKTPDIQGMIMLTPVFIAPDNRLNLMKILRFFMTWFYPAKMPSKSLKRLVRERVHDFDPTLDLDDPDVQKQLPMLSRIPTASLVEMLKMIEYGRILWPTFTIPNIIFHGGSDPAVKVGSIEKLFATLPGPDKQIREFPEAGHELMRPFDPVHEIVWKSTFDFIYERSMLRQPTH